MSLQPYKFQIHRYKNGHQLISSTVDLVRTDQDAVDRLSDISGQIRPGEIFDPYFTCYPLPSTTYFVVARTWQDMSAPRAGCVFTKSSIIPMEEWQITNQVHEIFDQLKELPNGKELLGIIKDTDENLSDTVENSPVNELVEALFLEDRKPILIFDSGEADKIICRLYTVFWPTIRNTFAACTYALAPRSLSGKPFDLLFSKSDLRSRFAEWKGRRIESVLNDQKAPRHRWTIDLAKRIFKNSVPTLFSNGTSNFFKFNELADESELRLSLLWSELLTKAQIETSPFSILALIDMINSQPNFSVDLYRNLQPYINKAIDDAPNKLNAIDAWKFYAALLLKHKKKQMNRQMLSAVKLACKNLSYSNPPIAIDFISNLKPAFEKIPAVLYAGAGDGIGQYMLDGTTSIIEKITSNLGLQLLATSPKFAEVLMNIIPEDPWKLSKKIEEYLKIGDVKSQQRAMSNLALFVFNPTHKEVLSFLLEHSDIQEYQRILSSIAKNTELRIREFDDIILKATLDLDQQNFLLQTLVVYDNKETLGPLFVKLLQNRPSLISSIYFDSDIPTNRKQAIISEALEELSLDSLIDLLKDTELSKALLPLLINYEDAKKEVIVYLLLNTDSSIIDALSELNKFPKTVINSVKTDVLVNFTMKALTHLPTHQYSLVAEFISGFNQINSDATAEYALHNIKNQQEAITVIRILMMSGLTMQNSLIYLVDFLSQLIANNLKGHLDLNITKKWSELVLNSDDQEKQRKAAAIMVDYAFTCDAYDPTDLLTVAFPIVYDTFLHDRTISQYFSFSFFTDWDKCRTLRHDLVKKYINSNWSHFGLLKVAAATGIMKEILSILSDSKTGKRYIKKAILETKNTNLPDNHPAISEFNKLYKSS